MNEFEKSRKLLSLASGAQVSIINLCNLDDKNRKSHRDNCKRFEHMRCDCLFCDLTHQKGLVE